MTEINFAKLQQQFPKSDVKRRPVGGNRTVEYITARHVMNRLDTVCGPENWRDEYAPSLTGSGIQCTLYLRINGEWIGKSDVGTESNTEEDKGAYSDALKRAAVRWGIGRELYGDGVANLDDDASPDRPPQPPQAPPRNDQPTRGASTPAPAKNASSDLDEILNGPEPDTRARALARETFPYPDSEKYTLWQHYISKTEKWNIPFWAAAKKTLKLTEDDVHRAVGVASVTDWGGDRGNVARLWLTLCEERIALDDAAKKREYEHDDAPHDFVVGYD